MRLLIALVAFGCTPRPASEAEVTAAAIRWPIPDDVCAELSPDEAHDPTSPLGDDVLEGWDEASIAALGERADPIALRLLLDLDAHERTRIYPEALTRDVHDLTGASRARRDAIAKILVANASSTLAVALASGHAESLSAQVLAAVEPAVARGLVMSAIACGARGPDARLVPLLATLGEPGRAALRELTTWPSWSVQEAALLALRSSADPADAEARSHVVVTTWSARLVAAAREHDELAASRRDHGALGCDSGVVWPAEASVDGAALVLPRPASLDRVLDDRVPSAWATVAGQWVDLRTAAHVALPLGDAWLYGVHRGEFGGGLYVREADGETRHLDPDPVVDMQQAAGATVVVSGTDHLGAHAGRILGISIGADGRVHRRHRFELPAAPQAVATGERGGVVVATALGIVALDREGHAVLRACDGSDPS